MKQEIYKDYHIKIYVDGNVKIITPTGEKTTFTPASKKHNEIIEQCKQIINNWK